MRSNIPGGVHLIAAHPYEKVVRVPVPGRNFPIAVPDVGEKLIAHAKRIGQFPGIPVTTAAGSTARGRYPGHWATRITEAYSVVLGKTHPIIVGLPTTPEEIADVIERTINLPGVEGYLLFDDEIATYGGPVAFRQFVEQVLSIGVRIILYHKGLRLTDRDLLELAERYSNLVAIKWAVPPSPQGAAADAKCIETIARLKGMGVLMIQGLAEATLINTLHWGFEGLTTFGGNLALAATVDGWNMVANRARDIGWAERLRALLVARWKVSLVMEVIRNRPNLNPFNHPAAGKAELNGPAMNYAIHYAYTPDAEYCPMPALVRDPNDDERAEIRGVVDGWRAAGDLIAA